MVDPYVAYVKNPPSSDVVSVRCRKLPESSPTKVQIGCSQLSLIAKNAWFCVIRKKNHQSEKLQLSQPASSSKASSLYSLEAVICIETSHYVSFVRARKEKPEGEFCWLFFDSMADRVEKSGVEQNVPIVRATSNIGTHLLKLDSLNPEQRYEYVVSHSYTKEEHFKRLVQDAYICVYKQKEMASPKPT